MNIFNKKFISISLALAIPVSAQAHWLGDATKAIFNKKKTIFTAIILGSTLMYAAQKLVDTLHKDIPTIPHDPTLYNNLADGSKAFLKDLIGDLNKAGGRYPRAKLINQKIGIVVALGLTAGLTYLAHKKNLFGEQ